MSLPMLCVIYGGENGTNECHLAVFTVYVRSFFPLSLRGYQPAHPPPSHPIGVVTSGIGYASNSYLKWWEIQLSIHSIVGEWIDYKIASYRTLANFMQVSVFLPELHCQIPVIRSGIAKYL